MWNDSAYKQVLALRHLYLFFYRHCIQRRYQSVWYILVFDFLLFSLYIWSHCNQKIL